MDVLLAIKPKYVKLITEGVKKYEFRKTIFKYKYVDKAYIYATAPMKKIVGVFDVGEVVRDTPDNLWYRFGDKSGMTKEEFFRYFKWFKKGYAIEIKNLRVFDEPIDPYEAICGFNPPQNFSYVSGKMIEDLVKR